MPSRNSLVRELELHEQMAIYFEGEAVLSANTLSDLRSVSVPGIPNRGLPIPLQRVYHRYEARLMNARADAVLARAEMARVRQKLRNLDEQAALRHSF